MIIGRLIFKQYREKGSALVTLLIFAGIAIYITFAFVSWASTSFRMGKHLEAKEQSFHLAEAGLEYYRWFLAHSSYGLGDDPPVPSSDLVVFDAEGQVVGTVAFNISSPVPASTVIQVEASGLVEGGRESQSRTLRSWLAIPSFAKYSLASNSDVRLGEGTEVFGELHSNKGMRFDGYANNIVTSAVETYDDPDHLGPFEFGVHTHVSPVDPIPPSAVPERPDVFGAGRRFPVPQVDFAGITQDLANLKSEAQSGGVYFSPSGRRGYSIRFNGNGTFDIWQVRQVQEPSFFCQLFSIDDDTWSIGQTRNRRTFAIPSNGVIFVEDHVWVRGQLGPGERITIASGVFPDTPATRTNIIVNENLIYSSYDGEEAMALIAQQDILVGLDSANELRIDGALVAQNGKVGRLRYGFWCGSGYIRDEITVYGMIASNERYGFAYTDGTGYRDRNIIYDANLLYSPPPNFPLTSDEHEILTWEEVE